MSDNRRGNVFKIASVYVSTIIGAGFVSGKELIRFFTNYHTGGYMGIVFAGILFSAIGAIVLHKVYRERIRNYEELIFPLSGWTLGWIAKTAVTLFLLTLYIVMIAGGGTIIKQSFHVPLQSGILIMALLCILVMLFDLKGVVAINVIAAPIATVGLAALGLYVLVTRDSAVFSLFGAISAATDNWFVSSLLYVSYNSLIAIATLTSLYPYLRSEKDAIGGGILGGASLMLVALILNYLIEVFMTRVEYEEIPVLAVVERYGRFGLIAYSAVLWLAMFSSAITAGYCLIGRFEGIVKMKKTWMVLILGIISVPLACYGFSNFINRIYPIFGYIGLFPVLLILFDGIKMLLSGGTGRFSHGTGSLRGYRNRK